jgi:predicted DCC family thiol-disulfide oxidoreductase YuxK
MMALAFFYLVLCLKTQLIAVESLHVPAALHTTILSVSTVASAKRSTRFYLKQANDENGSGGIETSSSLADKGNDFDWKAIADYVFDESIESPDTVNLYQFQDEQHGLDDDQSLENQRPHHHSKPIILFDGICNLCNGGVNFAIDHDRSGKFRFASLQSNVAKSLLLRDGKDPATTSDIVLFTSKRAYYSSEAVAMILAGLDMPVLKFLGVMGRVTPWFARNAVYRVVSGNRFVLGENDSCRMDFDGEYTSRFVSDPPESINVDMEKEDKQVER